MIKELILGTIFVLSTLTIWFILSTLVEIIGPPMIIAIILAVLSFTGLAYLSNKRKYK